MPPPRAAAGTAANAVATQLDGVMTSRRLSGRRKRPVQAAGRSRSAEKCLAEHNGEHIAMVEAVAGAVDMTTAIEGGGTAATAAGYVSS
mmetsp:Transcript_20217/g.56048  ORF Transcript_20217/g.56048 Transcript_20217/m.56048 type:complete len:89 (+) Transcript_20217:1767-2033(+)